MAITGPEKQLNLGNSDISVSPSPIIPAYLLIYTHYIFIITDVSVNWLLHPHYIHNILPVFISILILLWFLSTYISCYQYSISSLSRSLYITSWWKEKSLMAPTISLFQACAQAAGCYWLIFSLETQWRLGPCESCSLTHTWGLTRGMTYNKYPINIIWINRLIQN